MSTNDPVPSQPEDENKKNDGSGWVDVAEPFVDIASSLLSSGTRASSVPPINGVPAPEVAAEVIATNADTVVAVAEAGAAAGEVAGAAAEGVLGVVSGLFDGL